MTLKYLFFLFCGLACAQVASGQSSFMKVTGGNVVMRPGTHLKLSDDDGALELESGATFTMQWESFLWATGMSVASGGQLVAAGTLSMDGISNHGLILADSGESLTIEGVLLNSGTIRIENQTAFSVNGMMQNFDTGVLDMIFSPSSPPVLGVNEGTVVTAANPPRLDAPDLSGANPLLRILAYGGHRYQLQKSPDLSQHDSWTDVGSSVAATTMQLLEFVDTSTDPATSSKMFYRVLIAD